MTPEILSAGLSVNAAIAEVLAPPSSLVGVPSHQLAERHRLLAIEATQAHCRSDTSLVGPVFIFTRGVSRASCESLRLRRRRGRPWPDTGSGTSGVEISYRAVFIERPGSRSTCSRETPGRQHEFMTSRHEGGEFLRDDLRQRADYYANHSITSSGRGGSPPWRCRIRSKASKSARSRRCAKNAAVFIAASFSATAVATNWLTLVPSALARRTTSALTEVGRRSG